MTLQPAPQTPRTQDGLSAWDRLRTRVAIEGAFGHLPNHAQREEWIEQAVRITAEVTGLEGVEVLPLGGATQGLAKVRSWAGFRVLEPSQNGRPGTELLVVRLAKAKDNPKELVPAPFPGEGSGARGEEITKRFVEQYRAACGASPIDRLRPHVAVVLHEVTRPIHPYIPVAKDRLQKYWPQIGTGVVGVAIAFWIISGVVSCAGNVSRGWQEDAAKQAAIKRDLEQRASQRRTARQGAGSEIKNPEVAFLFQSQSDDEILDRLMALMRSDSVVVLTSAKDLVTCLEHLPRESDTQVELRESRLLGDARVEDEAASVGLATEVAYRLILASTASVTATEAAAAFKAVEGIMGDRESPELAPAIRRQFMERLSTLLARSTGATPTPAKPTSSTGATPPPRSGGPAPLPSGNGTGATRR